jgi:hypothetical protein
MTTTDDSRVIAAIGRSQMFIAAERARAALAGMAQHSRGIGALSHAIEKWSALPWAEQRFAAGVLVLAAVLVHVGVEMAAGTLIGWPAAILPAIACVSAILAMLTSLPALRRPR